MQQFQPESEVSLQTRHAANAWLAEFSPLVSTDEVFDESRCRERLSTLVRLRNEAQPLLRDVGMLQGQDDADLITTFRHAYGVMDRVEDDYRRQLAQLSPGNPDGRVNLESLRTRLAGIEARDELNMTQAESGQTLKLQTRSRSDGRQRRVMVMAAGMAAAMVAAIAVTSVHAGEATPALFAPMIAPLCAVFGLLAARRRLNGPVSVELNGSELLVKRGTTTKRHQMRPGSKVYAGWGVSARGMQEAMILGTDADGNEIQIPVTQAPELQQELIQKINRHLAAQT